MKQIPVTDHQIQDTKPASPCVGCGSKNPPPIHHPTVSQLEADYDEAVSRWVEVGFGAVLASQFQERMTACKSCSHWSPIGFGGFGRCGICEPCRTVRLWSVDVKCPDNPTKW